MIRKVLMLLTALAVVIAIVIFWGMNPGKVPVDLGFAQYTAEIPAAFVTAFVLGWLFGLFCASVFMLRLVNQRRRLRKQLRIAEAEVSSLRSLPLQDVGE